MATGNSPFQSVWLNKNKNKRKGLSPLKRYSVFGVNDVALETAMISWFFPGNSLTAIETNDTASISGTVFVSSSVAIIETVNDTASLIGSSPPADTLINFSPLIIPFDGVDNGTIFVDGKNHTLTTIGSAITSTAQSKFGGASGYFNGSGSITSANSADLDVNNVDYCIEFWVYLPTGSTGGQVIRYGKPITYTNYGIKITSTGVINVSYGDSTGTQSADFSDPAGLPRDQWVFVKMSRVGTSVQCWVNGANYYAALTATKATGIITDATLCIGNNQESNLPFQGYLDDLRLTIGDARTATNTTVPTYAFQPSAFIFTITGNLSSNESALDSFSSAATVDITGILDSIETASLDTLTSTGTVDVSASMVSIEAASLDTLTCTGTVDVSASMVSVELGDAMTSDGSVSVTASLDSLENNLDNASFVGFLTVSNNYTGILTSVESSTLDTFSSTGIALISAAIASVESSTLDTLNSTGIALISAAIASVESSTLDTFSSTGIALISAAMASVESSNDNFLGGNNTQSYFDAYIDNVVLLCNFNAGIIDLKGHSLTASNGAAITSTQSKWGGSSAYFDGIDDEIISPGATNFDIPASIDFCIECWVYLPTGSSGGQIIRYGKTTNYRNWGLLLDSTGRLKFEYGNNITSDVWVLSNSIARDQWVFLKASKTGTAIQGWVNGLVTYLAGVAVQNTEIIMYASLFIGRTPENTNHFNGYIDDLRVTIGNSRVSTDTIVPTRSFPLIGMPKLTGSLITTITTNSLLAVGRGYRIYGEITTRIITQSICHATRNYSIIGLIQTYLTPAAPIIRKGIVGTYVITGTVTITVHVQAQLAVSRAYSLFGHINLNITPQSDMGIHTHYEILGYIFTEIVTNSLNVRRLTNGIDGHIITRVKPQSKLSKNILINSDYISRKYICTLTGYPDIDIPISSFSANLSVSGLSTLNIIVNSLDLLDKIIIRKSGYLIIKREYTYNDGSKQSRIFIKMPFSALRTDNGPKSGQTITLIGNKLLSSTTSKSITLSEIMYRSFTNGLIRYRCAINDEITLGDEIQLNNEKIIVGKITYSVNANNEIMEILEYQANALDQGSAIGLNAIAKTLTEYIVNLNHINYSTWLAKAVHYTGINKLGSFSLYFDSLGFLYYLPGSEGESNIPVLLADNLTHAKINV